MIAPSWIRRRPSGNCALIGGTRRLDGKNEFCRIQREIIRIFPGMLMESWNTVQFAGLLIAHPMYLSLDLRDFRPIKNNLIFCVWATSLRRTLWMFFRSTRY